MVVVRLVQLATSKLLAKVDLQRLVPNVGEPGVHLVRVRVRVRVRVGVRMKVRVGVRTRVRVRARRPPRRAAPRWRHLPPWAWPGWKGLGLGLGLSFRVKG